MTANGAQTTAPCAPCGKPPVVLWILQTTGFLLAAVFCLRGHGSILGNIALAAAIPLGRLIFDKGFRRKWASRALHYWKNLENGGIHAGKIPWRPALLFVVIPSALLFSIRGFSLASADSRPVMLASASLIQNQDSELSEYLQTEDGSENLPYFLTKTPMGIFSNYPSGMVFFALPVTLAAKLVGAELQFSPVQNRLEKLTAMGIASVSLGMFFLIALHVVPLRPALLVTACLAIGSSMATTVAQGLWQHGGVIFCMLGVLFIEFRNASRPMAIDSWIQGALCGLMLACRLSSVLFVVPLVLWVFLRNPGRALLLSLLAITCFLPWAAFYWSAYQNPFGPSTGQMSSGLWNQPFCELPGVLFSPARGLVVYQPWVLLAIPALFSKVRNASMSLSNMPKGWMVFCSSVIVLLCTLASSWGMWWGGYSWGSRLLAEAVPLLGLLCLPGAAFLMTHAMGKAVLTTLLAIAAFMHLPVLLLGNPHWNESADIDNHPERLWIWSKAPFGAPFRNQHKNSWEPLPAPELQVITK